MYGIILIVASALSVVLHFQNVLENKGLQNYIFLAYTMLFKLNVFVIHIKAKNEMSVHCGASTSGKLHYNAIRVNRLMS